MIYSRHIFFRTLLACLGSVGLFVAVLVAGNLIKDVLRLLAAGQMSAIFFAKTLFSLVPSVVSYALPLGMVTGILLVVGRMSARNEILILRTSGLSLFRIALPIFFLAILATFLALFINLFHAPRALYAYRQSLRNLIREEPLHVIQPNRFIREFSGYILYAGGKDEEDLTHLHIWEFDSQHQLTGFLKAERGRFIYDQDRDCLRLHLSRGSYERHQKMHQEDIWGSEPTLYFGEFTLNLPLGKIFTEDQPQQKRLKHRDFWELRDAFEHWSSTEIPPLERSPEQKKSDDIQVNFLLQQSLAMALSIPLLALLAVPLALKTRRRETSFNVALALGLSLLYYFSMAVISWFQALPWMRADWLIWLPNGVLLVLGLWCFHGAQK